MLKTTMTRTLAASLAVLALAGCTQPGSSLPTPRRTVLAMESALTTADLAAIRYTSLPRCGAGAARLCSDPAVVARIKASAQRAHDAVVAAQAAVDADPGAGASSAVADAQAALAALESVVASLPAQGSN